MKIVIFFLVLTVWWDFNYVSAGSKKQPKQANSELQIDVNAINQKFVGKIYVAPGTVVPNHLSGLKVLYNNIYLYFENI